MGSVCSKHGELKANYFPLTPEEVVAFGWGDDPSTIIMSTRSPCGRRLIPTRQKAAFGGFFYGEILTAEPPPGVSFDDWDVDFSQDTIVGFLSD